MLDRIASDPQTHWPGASPRGMCFWRSSARALAPLPWYSSTGMLGHQRFTCGRSNRGMHQHMPLQVSCNGNACSQSN
jgi:hypothetical protein